MNPESPVPETDDPVQEELVAYLDGELDAEARRRVESRLAEDEQYRARLAALDTAWECLDYLSPVEAGESFTRTTVEMVALAAEEEVQQSAAREVRRSRLWWVAAAVAFVAAGVGGYLVAASVWPSANDQLVRDLDAIAYVDLYQNLDGLDYLRRLYDEGLFTIDVETSPDPREMPVIAPTDPELRHEWVVNLSDVDKEELRRKQERFDRLDPAQQDHARRLHEQIAGDDQADELTRVMVAYNEWLKTLPAARRAELPELSIDQRVERIKQWMQEQQSRHLERFANVSLAPEDLRGIFAWLDEFARRHEAELMEVLPEDVRSRVERIDDAGIRRRALFFGLGFRGPETKLPVPNDEEIQQFRARLSPATQKDFDKITDPQKKLAQMHDWIRGAVTSGVMYQAVPPEVLKRFFAGLSEEQRQKLEALPEDQFRAELRRQYFFNRFRGPEGWGGRKSPGGGPWPGLPRDPRFGPPPGQGKPPSDGPPRKPPGPGASPPPSSL